MEKGFIIIIIIITSVLGVGPSDVRGRYVHAHIPYGWTAQPQDV